MRLVNAPMGTLDLSADAHTAPFNVETDYIYSVQGVITGTATGSASLFASNDGVHFSEVANSALAVTGAGTVMWNVTLAGYKWVQVEYTRTANSGSMVLTIEAKGI